MADLPIDVKGYIALWDAYSMRSTLAGAMAKGGDTRVLSSALADLPDVDALGALQANAAAVDLLTSRRWYVIRDAREAGASWAQVGEALGITEQEAREFYLRKIEHQERYVPNLHETRRSRAVLTEPVEWEDIQGVFHELLPVGSHVLYSGHVLLGEGHDRTPGGTVYDAEPAVVIGHDVDEDVMPYLVRIDADGVQVRCTPGEVVQG